MTLEAALALTRFGLGPRPGELDKTARDPKGWLRRQTRDGDASVLPSSEADDLLSGAEGMKALRTYLRDRRGSEGDKREEMATAFRALSREKYLKDMTARFNRGLSAPDGFRERMVYFWSDHFTISVAGKGILTLMAGSLEREAVRPRVMGRFEDMLIAATAHPAMLIYLDNIRSFGPNSPVGRRRNRGLNENHAREILELHTLGVDGGYTQDDVVALAKILTGWTIDRETGAFRFRPVVHEPGAQTVLGRTYDQNGVKQGRKVLRDLARHPATARHVARKLAVAMHSDNPPESLISRLENSFLRTGGDLGALAEALIAAPEMWTAEQAKIKTPEDLVLSAIRILGARNSADRQPLLRSLQLLGQRPFAAPSPAGWPDTAADWAGPNALQQRLEWANTLSQRIGRFAGPPLHIAEAALGPLLSDRTRQAIEGAMTAEQGLALFLMSPEFQRR